MESLEMYFVKKKSSWIGAFLNPNDRVFIRIVKYTGEKRSCEDGGRDSSDAATSQGMPRMASSHQKSQRSWEWLSSRVFRGAG
jgi:hypothetical protein